MTVVTNTWRQLVRRRLWPLAVLLVAALAAVPVLLSRDPKPVHVTAEPAPAVTSDADEALAEPVVAKVAAEDRTRRRRVLGFRKDPFKPAPLPKPKKPKAQKSAPSAQPKQATDIGGSTAPASPTYGGGVPSLGPSGPITIAPGVTPVAPKKKTYPAGSLVVKFGSAESAGLERMLLRKLDPLPDDETPLLVYLGLTKDHKKAKFLIDDTITPDGDGTCKPHPASCETVQLRKGETEFFEVTDPETGEVSAQYELDLLKINAS
jgi:hypothetical protein